jgi:hypothetical protein
VRIAPAAVDLPEVINSLAPERLLTSHPAKLGADRLMCGALSFLVERPLGKQWTLALARHQNGAMRPRGSRPDALQSVTVLEALEGLAGRHGEAGVPFKDLEATTRSRLNYRALTDALNALVHEGAVRRVTEKPARLAITDAGRKRLNEYRS